METEQIIIPNALPGEEFQPVERHEEYYVSNKGRIFSKNRYRFLVPFQEANGYMRVQLNGNKYYVHRLVANAFIENPEPEQYAFVDHINHDRSDNNASNLRWCSHIQNCNNRANDEFVQELPENAITVNRYGRYEFRDLYYANNLFYKYNGINYKIIRPYLDANDYYKIKAVDINKRSRNISLIKFKRLFDLI